jgi:hypothetical protein
MATKNETAAAATVAGISTFTAVALRKIAAQEYGIKGASKGKKADLLAAIYLAEVERGTIEALAVEIAKGSNPREALDEVARANAAEAAEEELLREAAREHDAAAEKIAAELAAKPAPVAKPAPKGRKCEVCGVKPINRKTQGRDSTMCTGCYDYASWGNTHSDEDHEGTGGRDADCPVCDHMASLDAKEDAKPAPAKAAKKAPAPVVNGENPKAARFAADAKAAGWSVGSVKKVGNVTTVIVNAAGGEWIQISWDGTQCVNTGTTHKGQDGKVRKVRNASAARAILVA